MKAGREISDALDQWRGMALLFVLVNHAFKHTGLVDGWGRAGVNLFFFISGLLTYKSLASIHRKTPGRLFPEFYRRRLLRLLPAMVVFVIALWAIYLFLDREKEGAGMLTGLLWVRNYFKADILSAHLWSTSCEMQFYALAPILFLLAASAKRAVRGFVFLLFGLMLAAALVYPLSGAGVISFRLSPLKYAFEYSAWPMMAGFLAEAYRGQSEAISARYGTWLRVAFWGSVALMLGISLAGMKFLLVAVASGLIIGCAQMHYCGRRISGRAGEILTWLGVRTYSIYLWQQVFTVGGIVPPAWRWLGLVPAIVIGAVMFRYVEVPAMRRKPA